MPYDFSLTLEVPVQPGAPSVAAPAAARDISQARALVVDGQPASRGLLMSQLREIGIGTLKHASSPSDARLLLERGTYDFVFCETAFPDPDESGLDLLDELRRENLLPYSTVFIMVTSQADYAQVREAAESVVDGYLLRPYSGQSLADRLHEARRRKLALADVFRALESGRTDDAIRLALDRVQARSPYWGVCARLATELLLQAERFDEVSALLRQVIEARDAGWARLALVRMLTARGELGMARREADALVAQMPEYADAYDVLGRLQVDQGELGAALETFRMASKLTPGCLLRLQHTGTLAFYTGAIEEAIRCLERVVALGMDSKLFDALTLALLAIARHDRGDLRGVSLAHEQLQQFVRRHPSSGRLRRLATAAGIVEQLGMDAPGAAAEGLRRLAGEHRSDAFDVEATTILLAVLSRVPQALADSVDCDALARTVALRCSVSRVVTDVLVAAAGPSPALVEIVRTAHAEMNGIAERAVAMSARHRPRQAINLLLEHGRRTLNAKLIDMAAMIAVRHRDGLEDAETLMDLIASLQERYCRPVTHLAGVMRARRPPGAMALRTPLPTARTGTTP